MAPYHSASSKFSLHASRCWKWIGVVAAVSLTFVFLAALIIAMSTVCDIFGCSHALRAHRPVPPNAIPRNASEPYELHVVTFATPMYAAAASRLIDSAMTVAGADVAERYAKSSLDADFVRKNAHILKQPRGAGYWIWKPYVIFKHMVEKMNVGDVLIYSDSLYEFSDVPPVRKWLGEEGDIAIFCCKPHENDATTEKTMSKRDAFHHMNVDYSRDFPQIWAGFVVLRKTSRSLRFVGEWLTYVQDERIVTDSPSVLENDAVFVDNRHDQTVLSLLVHKWGIVALEAPGLMLSNKRSQGLAGTVAKLLH